MSKSKRERNSKALNIGLGLSALNDNSNKSHASTAPSEPIRTGIFGYLRARLWLAGLITLLSLGVFGSVLKYLDEDAQREKLKNGKDRSMLSSVNPFMPAPTPDPTPQLSKEYVYAGSRLLAVEDAAASAVPPADLAVWRPSNGYWYVKGAAGSTETYYPWGNSSDVAAPGDYDGDGKTDFAVYRGSETNWYIVKSSNNAWYGVAQGGSGDNRPVLGDYDGDGKTDNALFRAGVWYIIRSSDSSTYSTAFGLSTDKTAPGDFDGDGKTDPTVWRGSDLTYYTLRSSDGTWFSAQVGSSSTDIPVPGDYDGDGVDDMAVLSGTNWIIRSSSTGSVGTAISWGNADDIPVQNDYDGDGKVDIAVWRNSNGNWYIRKSGSGGALRQEAWGTSGDIPVPALYRR